MRVCRRLYVVARRVTQDSCGFYEDHAIFEHFSGVVLDTNEGDRIAEVPGERKAVILQNHGILTVGASLETAVWRYFSMENACQAQLLADAVGRPSRCRMMSRSIQPRRSAAATATSASSLIST